jgi:AcrR family transcriptional regulator
MARPKGTKNPEHDEKRAALLARLRQSLSDEQPPSSFRELAEAAGVTIPTLRHYFGNREAVLEALFVDCHAGAAGELEVARRPQGSLKESIRQLLAHLAGGFQYGGLTDLHAAGLVEGLRHREVARAYLSEVLEPTLAAVEERLKEHMERGEMARVDARMAALQLVSGVMVLYLHQDGLGGGVSYPMQVETFLEMQAEWFCRAFAPEGA